MTPLVLAVAAGAGAYLLYSELALETNRLRTNGRRSNIFNNRSADLQHRLEDTLVQAGLAGADRRRVGVLIAVMFATGTLFGWALFGGFVVSLIVGLLVGSFPVASYRQRRRKRAGEASEAWPRLIDEIRLRCGSLGQPIPQALLEVGKLGPSELRPSFVAAEREWLLSTDFERTVSVLKAHLADPTADATCETLLVAHSVGGTDVERRLSALSEDRRVDLHGRKDAKAKQAGVRFARRFVLLVPVGMALVGISIGNGRDAYSTASGQLGVAFGVITLALCWWWAGRLIQLPSEERVFRG